MYVTGGKFGSNGTTRVPKSIPRLVLDKVRLLFMSVVFDSGYININKGWVAWWIAG